MSLIEVFVLSIGVAMDAFAVSICKGITIKDNIKQKACIVGTWFGFFQGLMPLIGFFFMGLIDHYFHGIKEYVIFGLLTYIGVSMIVDAFKREEKLDSSLKFSVMLMLAIATSLDALSIGVTLSLLNVNIFISVLMISVVTFLFCFVGVFIGSKFGDKYKSKAELVGGLILLLIGLRVLLNYLL